MHRLAIFVPNLEGGGMERVAVDLANGLVAEDVGVDLVLARASGPYLADVSEDVRVVDLDARRIRSAILPLGSYLRSERPDALLSMGFHTNVAGIVAGCLTRSRPRLVLSQHSMISAELATMPKLKRKALGFLLKTSYRRAHAVVAVSKGTEVDLRTFLGRSVPPLEVIYNPIDVEKIIRHGSVSPRHPWLIEDGTPTVVSVGRLVPAKDHATLIHAFSLVAQASSARLIVFGEGSERSRLESLVRALDLDERVDLPGFDPDPYPAMSHAAAFVLSSRYEGLAIVLLEALCLGVPVVATDCKSGPSEVLDSGRLGRLVPVGDVQALAAGMLAAIDEPRISAANDIALRYDTAVIAPRYREVLLNS